MKILFDLSCSVSLLLLLAACSSTATKSPTDSAARVISLSAPPAPTSRSSTLDGSSSNPAQIDAIALQSSLGLDRAQSQLGFQERAFDTCQVGYGFSSSQDCQKKFFVVIHFQLMCRDSEGTTSDIITSDNLQPIAGKPVGWSLKNKNTLLTGQTQTDSEGFGQIRAITLHSPSQHRLKLTIGNDFLYLKAGEVNRVVTPLSWCNQQTARR